MQTDGGHEGPELTEVLEQLLEWQQALMILLKEILDELQATSRDEVEGVANAHGGRTAMSRPARSRHRGHRRRWH